MGLATGTTCLATCAPIYIPYLIAEKRDTWQSFKVILQITVGRFISYAAFGAAFGFIGSQIPVGIRDVFTSVSYIFLSIFLLLTVFRIQKHKQNCAAKKWMKLTKNPFLLGIITGISFCPAFLIAISNAIEISGIAGGVSLFVAFFLGTSIFIIPFTLLGILSRVKLLRTIARVSAVLIAVFFIYKGGSGFLEYYHNKDFVNRSFMKSNHVYILATNAEAKWQKLVELDPAKFQIVSNTANLNDTAAVVLDETLIAPDIYNQLVEGKHKIINIRLKNFKSKEDFQKLTEFLGSVNFRYKPDEGYNFDVEKPPVWKY